MHSDKLECVTMLMYQPNPNPFIFCSNASTLGMIFLKISLFSPAVLTCLLLSIKPGEFVDVADKLGEGGGRRGEG